MRIRRLFFAALGGFFLPTSWAEASFDMMLLPDTNTNRVVRFDPNNRVALGVFGDFGPFGGVRYVTAGAGGQASLTSDTGTSIVNYNTSLVSGLQLSPYDKTSFSPNGGRLFTGVSNFIETYSPSLSFQAQWFGPNVINTVAATSDNLALTFGWNSGSVMVRSFNTSGSFSSAVFAGSLVANGSIGSSQAAVNGTTAMAGVSFVDTTGVRYQARVVQNLTTGTFIITSNFLPIGNLFAQNANVMVMPGHGGWWLVGDDAANADITRIGYYASDFSSAYSYTTNAVNVPRVGWGRHNIVAPEPGTIAALGIGLAVLLKRRRR